jgi:hypothetical protein
MSKQQKFIFEKSYTIPNRAFVVSSSLFRDGSRVFKDWEDFGPQNLPEYFNKGYRIFLQKLEEFKNLERPLKTEEEQELNFMLEALIHAKNARYEDSKN